MHIYNALLNLKWVNPFTYNSFRRFRISKFLKRIRKACSNNYIYIYLCMSLVYIFICSVTTEKVVKSARTSNRSNISIPLNDWDLLLCIQSLSYVWCLKSTDWAIVLHTIYSSVYKEAIHTKGILYVDTESI